MEAEAEVDDVRVGNDATRGTHNPCALRKPRLVERGADTKGGDSMRENGSGVVSGYFFLACLMRIEPSAVTS